MKNSPILIVDDTYEIVGLIKDILIKNGYTNLKTAETGRDAVQQCLKEVTPISIIDVNLPDMTGLEVMTQIKAAFPPAKSIIITGMEDENLIIEALQKDACDYIRKPVSQDRLLLSIKRCWKLYKLEMANIEYRDKLEEKVEERTKKVTQTLEELKLSNLKLGKVFRSMIDALSKTIQVRDVYTAKHQFNVAILARAIAVKMKRFSEFQLESIEWASKLHDIGKLYVPADLLTTPRLLDNDEKKIIQKHSLKSYEILNQIPFDDNIAIMALQHHERMDGSGYPNGLKGDEILIESRILAVADVVEAVIAHRSYRPSLGIDMAISILKKERGTLLCRDAVDACIEVIKDCDNNLESLFTNNTRADGGD